MSDDIDAFLRRAAQRRKAVSEPQPPTPVARQPAPAAPTGDAAIPTISRSLQQTQSDPHAARGDYSSAQADRLAPARMERMGKPQVRPVVVVSDALPDSEDEVARLSVEEADDRMKSHMDHVFAHQVGALQVTQTHLLDNGSVTGMSLYNLLQQPGGLQTALLLREILERPTHRW